MSATERLAVAIDVSAIHARSGGARTYVTSLVRSLSGAGIDPVLVARRRGAAGGRAESRADDWTGATEIRRVAPTSRPLRLLWEQTSLLRAAEGPPVLHSPHYTMPEMRRRGRPPARVVTIHDLTFFTMPAAHAAAKRLLFRRAIALAARRADALIAVSDRTAELLARYTSPRAPIHVITHGVDRSVFHPRSAALDRGWLDRYGITPPYLLFLGALEPRKNVPDLVRAYDLLAATPPFRDHALVLAGQAWLGMDREIPVAEHGRVVRTGFVDDDARASLYRCAAAVIYPSFDEGFGLPILEAACCGTPVVAHSGAPAAASGAAALIAGPGPAALARAVEDAIAHGPVVPTVASWDDVAAAHARVYRSVVPALDD